MKDDDYCNNCGEPNVIKLYDNGNEKLVIKKARFEKYYEFVIIDGGCDYQTIFIPTIELPHIVEKLQSLICEKTEITHETGHA